MYNLGFIILYLLFGIFWTNLFITIDPKMQRQIIEFNCCLVSLTYYDSEGNHELHATHVGCSEKAQLHPIFQPCFLNDQRLSREGGMEFSSENKRGGLLKF